MTISKPEAAQKTVDRVLNVLGNRSGSLPKESTAPAVQSQRVRRARWARVTDGALGVTNSANTP